MGGKPEAEKAKKPSRRKMTPEEQSALFIKTARELGVDETGGEFERAFEKIARSRPPASPEPNIPSPRASKCSRSPA